MPTGQRVSAAALLSASKGFNLKRALDENPLEIKFWCEAGTTIQREIYWLHANLRHKLRQPEFTDCKYLFLFVWLGTCDLTRKTERGCIALREQNIDKAVSYIAGKLEELLDLLSKYQKVRPVLIENTYYSIVKYNESKGHPHPDEFAAQDRLLFEQITKVNVKIKELNHRLGNPDTVTPSLNTDLQHRTKKKGKPPVTKYNYNLLKDGLHPRELLSKVWVRKLVRKASIVCFDHTAVSSSDSDTS